MRKDADLVILLRRAGWALLALAATLVLLAGCAPAGSRDRRDDTIVIALQSSPTSLDPRLATDAISSRVIDLIFNGLFRSGQTGQLEKDLAENFELADETTYLFKLRQGVFFHNGEELTAPDVKFTIESVLDPKTGSRKRAAFRNVESIEVLGKYRLRIRLKQPQASFLETLKIGIVPAGYASEKEEDFSSHPVGTGPFKLLEWHKGSHLKLVRHNRYFRQPPPVKWIVCKIVPETSTRLLELRKGSVDFLENDVPPEAVRSFSADARFKVVTAPSSTYKYIGFNLEHPILSKLSVRQAIAYAIDRKAIIDHLLLGQAVPATGLLAPGNPFYEPNVKRYEHDPQKAVSLLDDAGLFPDPKSHIRLTLTFKTSKDERANQIAQIIQEQLRAVGIAIKIISLEWATFYSDILSGNFEMYSLTWVGVSDPDFFYDIFNSNSFPPNGQNRGHYRNPLIDRLTDEGRRELNFERRFAIYSQVQKTIAHDLPYLSLWHPMNVAIMTRRLEGFTLYPAGDFKSFEHVRLANAE